MSRGLECKSFFYTKEYVLIFWIQNSKTTTAQFQNTRPTLQLRTKKSSYFLIKKTLLCGFSKTQTQQQPFE